MLGQVLPLTEGQFDELVRTVEKRRSKTKALRGLEGSWGKRPQWCLELRPDNELVVSGHANFTTQLPMRFPV